MPGSTSTTYLATVSGNPIPEGVTKIKIIFYMGLEDFQPFEFYGNVSNGVISCMEEGVTWFEATWIDNNQYSIRYVDAYNDGAPSKIFIGDIITTTSEDFKTAVEDVFAPAVVFLNQAKRYNPSNDDTLPSLPSGYVWQIDETKTFDFGLDNEMHNPFKFGDIVEIMKKDKLLLTMSGDDRWTPIHWNYQESENYCTVDVSFVRVIEYPSNIQIQTGGIAVKSVQA